MSGHLWQCFLEDDVDKFRQILAWGRTSSGDRQGASVFESNDPSTTLASSPKPIRYHRPGSWTTSTPSLSRTSCSSAAVLSRAEINARDSFGRTLLHHIASSHLESAASFATALLETGQVDLYAQDLESGWTALHRAFYCGNISIARALLAKDVRDGKYFPGNAIKQHVGGLIRIKDHEGNGPFDVYNASTASRDISIPSKLLNIGTSDQTAESNSELSDHDVEVNSQDLSTKTSKNCGLQGDEIFTFGSNKNLSLGLGDGDDRQYPEKVSLTRPLHLLQRLQREADPEEDETKPYRAVSESWNLSENPLAGIPALIRHSAPIIQDVKMSKFATAILTKDPESNLYISGFGPGGRLGLGDESTRFQFHVVDLGALSHKRVTSVILGQDHSLAITDGGEVCSWGSNKYGQLGYMTGTSQPPAEAMQLLPRRIFGCLKKECVVGAAASAIHTIIFTSSGSLYSFGKNEGQLGLMDADSRSLEIQPTPRRVAASLFASPVLMVGAINRASICLLESKEVLVFTHYGFSKINFISDGFVNSMSRDRASRPTKSVPQRYKESRNKIIKVIAGGNVLGAISSFGEVFTLSVGARLDSGSGNASTTNPSKIRNALTPPCRVWANRKSHMRAWDASVDQDDSMIVCTESGSLWKRQRRPKIHLTPERSSLQRRSRDFKFVRIPGMTRAQCVRSNAFGAFAVVRHDYGVMKNLIVDPQTLWRDVSSLLPFRGLPAHADAGCTTDISSVKKVILSAGNTESDISDLVRTNLDSANCRQILWMKTDTSVVAIPIHEFLLVARSKVMRAAFNQFRLEYYFGIPDTLSIEYGSTGEVIINFTDISFLTLLSVVFYMYTDAILDLWHCSNNSVMQVSEYKQVRLEIIKVAGLLHLPQLERAARLQIDPTKTMHNDMELAFSDSAFSDAGDLLLDLDGATIRVHSAAVQLRCPFFKGLLAGTSGSQWLGNRQSSLDADHTAETVRVDLRHFKPEHFNLVLRYLYCDSGEELFSKICTNDLDDFLDFVIDVMAIADELMLERLAQICQSQLGRFVNPRNVCPLLNAVASCAVREFKIAALEYICLNLETMLQNRYLEDLDEDLLLDLDDVVRENQIAYLPFSRSGRIEAELFETHPQLSGVIARNRQARIDQMQNRIRSENELREEFDASVEKQSPLAASQGCEVGLPDTKSWTASAAVTAQSQGDLIFQMDDDQISEAASPGQPPISTTASASSARAHYSNTTGSPRKGPSSHAFSKMTQLAHGIDSDIVGDSGQTHTELHDSIEGTKTMWFEKRRAETRVDMRNILAESSRTVVPAIPVARFAAKSVGSFKISQKERKRQLQQQQMMSESVKDTIQSSPWEAPKHRSPASDSKTLSFSMLSHHSKPLLEPRRPSMTVRQTISGGASAVPRTTEESGWSDSSGVPRQSGSSITKPATPNSVRSVRHLPPPSVASPQSMQLPMADILLQQQSEKDAIQEAAASKRSLQEIQQEQEFQEWWDAESQRVMAEEAVQAQSSPREAHEHGRSMSHRRRGRGTGRGRGQANTRNAKETPKLN